MSDIHAYYTVPKKFLVSFLISGATLVQLIVNSSLMKFYTTFIGLKPEIWATIFLLFTIWNAVNDPVIGYLTDKVKFIPGKGKYKRVIMYAVPLMAITVIPLFFVNPSWSQMGMAAYLLILMVFYEAAQTLTNVSFNAFKINTFLSMKKRSEFQMILTYVKMPTTFLAMLIPMWFLSGNYSTEVVAWIFTGAIIVGLIFMVVGILFLKEDASFYTNESTEMNLKDLYTLFIELSKNKSFRRFVIAIFLITVAAGNYGVGYTYYMYDVLRAAELQVVIPDILTGVVQMLTFPVIVKFVGRKGSRDAFIIGIAIAAIGHLILTFNVNYWVVAITYIVILFGYGFYSIIYEPLQGLIVDEMELETGHRRPAAIAGILQVFTVLATGLLPVIIGYALGATGYIEGAGAIQPDAVKQAIRYSTGLFPAVILFLSIIALKSLPIDLHREKEIQHLIEQKHHQRTA